MKTTKHIILTFFSLVLIISTLTAKDLNPTYSLSASGGVTDLVYKNQKLYVATTASSVDIFDIPTKSKIDSIKIPKIKDFMGDEINSKIYSVDVLDNKILILSQGNKGGRAINIYENGKFHEIISDTKRMFIARAKFLDENRIIFALLSNQLFIYDLKENKKIKEVQISQSKFSHFKLDEKKKNIVVADESGNLKMLNSSNLEVEKIFKNKNLDNVFQVDIKNNHIITAGQDRRCVVYDFDKESAYYKEASFLIYSAALNPNATIGAFASDEENNITVFDIASQKSLYTLKQNPALITNILFINDNEIFVSSDHEKINYYKID